MPLLPLKAKMKLAKPRIDIGFATNNASAALAFWQNEIGLPFDHTQPIPPRLQAAPPRSLRLDPEDQPGL